MATITLNLLLALAWAAVTGVFSLLNLAFGFVLGGLAIWLISEQVGSAAYFRKFGQGVALAFIFVIELIKASVTVAVIVLSPKPQLRPAIIAYPLRLKGDGAISLLANLITLTPGTLSMDVSSDRTTLYIHSIDAPEPDEIIRDIQHSFEDRIARLFEE